MMKSMGKTEVAMIPLGKDDSSGELPKDEDDEDVDHDEESAAKDVMDALEAKDVKLFARALKNFIAEC